MNTADVTGSKPIAIWSQSLSGVSAINPLVAFYDIHGRKNKNNIDITDIPTRRPCITKIT
jgi:hypothetical protein